MTWREIKQAIKDIKAAPDILTSRDLRLMLAERFIQSIADGEQPHPDKAKLILSVL